ncbi:MAG: DUF4065 domain-containing protein [Desulfobacteraceae bacterium]|nr:MAG: DUF4065 domain-containing protein [Desulfobacteraceae bacterium]
MVTFRFDEKKALSAILYISQKLIERHRVCKEAKPDMHRISKILYFADRKHLARFGRPIIGDHFVAMKDGPVPSKTYDLMKAIKGESPFCSADKFINYFEVKGFMVHPKKKPDLDDFSESDIECIKESLKENQDLTFGQLKAKSHDSAYNRASVNNRISFIAMAKAEGINEDMISYIETVAENQQPLTI